MTGAHAVRNTAKVLSWLLHRVVAIAGRPLPRRASALHGMSVLVLCFAGCATKRQTAQALSVAGTTAVVAGLFVASQAGCNDGLAQPYDATGYPNRSRCSGSGRGQQLGAAISGVGLAAAAAGATLQEQADRLDAWKRASLRQPSRTANTGDVSHPHLLTLPPAAFSLTPAPPAPLPSAATATLAPAPGPSRQAPGASPPTATAFPAPTPHPSAPATPEGTPAPATCPCPCATEPSPVCQPSTNVDSNPNENTIP